MIRNCVLIAVVVLPSVSVWAQQPPIEANLLVEATQISRGIGNYKSQHLWVRLRKDGAVKWEQPLWGKPNEVHSGQISTARVAVIAKDLNTTDWTKFRGKMGPYNVYIDSSIEFEIRLVTATGEHQFEVVNPWPGHKLKALPAEVERTLCQLQILRAQASEENKIMAMCADTLHVLECSEGTKPCVK